MFWSSQFVILFLLQPTDVFSLTTNDSENGSCSVYLADSSIDNAGYGVFAGRDFEVGDHIGEGGLGIQIIDPNEKDFQTELMYGYVKNSNTVGGDGEAQHVLTLLPGLSMLVNFHPDLINVLGSGLNEGSILDRQNHHGAGAVTSYHNFTLVAKKYVKQGEELFFDFPEEWYKNRDGDNAEDIIPIAADYRHADKLVKNLVNYAKKHPTLRESALIDVLLRIKTLVIKDLKVQKNLIPDTLEGLIEGAEKGTARAMLNDRSMEWIEENGKCLDNLKPGPSTLSGAGRGAFATRFLPKGSVIAPCPLIHITKKEILLMTKNINNDSNNKYQLLLNYCFGHRNSSLLLCPTTSAALINHSSDNFNAVYKWAAPSTNKKKEDNHRMRPMEDLEPQSSSIFEYNSKLAFDFIATRDIFEGEEIFIDYGQEWIDAWKAHVQVWKRENSAESYVPSSVLNALELKINPLNEGTFHHKQYAFLCEMEPFAQDEDVSWGEPTEEDYFMNPYLNKSNWDESLSKLYLENDFLWWWPCEVEEQKEGNDLYNVRVFQRKAEIAKERSTIRIIKNFPRKSIKFIDKPYHSDQHLPNTFRHYLPIPDDIFPLHWRNDYDSVGKFEFTVKGSDGSSNDEVIQNFEKTLREAKCGLYLATSTIPDAGKGVFLGVPLPSEDISFGNRPAIPITNFFGKKWSNFMDYTWISDVFEANFESNAVEFISFNEGALANYHPGLVNMYNDVATSKPILDRRRDPGAGAFSDTRSFNFRSKNALEIGQELFISYGESWFAQRPHLQKVPLSSNYAEANSIMSSLLGLSSGPEPTLDKEQASDLLDFIQTDVVLDERTKNVFSSLKTSDYMKIANTKSTIAELTVEKRSIGWLEKNGQCLDHIYVKDSTIPQAGKGAFALRFIASGSTIISSPMLNSWGRDTFDIDSRSIGIDINEKNLVYNYMWAHPESSLLLFPLTTAFAINHASCRNVSDFNPNAEIRWSQTDKKSMYYQQSNLETLKKEKYAPLVLDFVATRNILPDEEILIDYGKAWEDRWNTHVKNFQSPCSANTNLCLNSSVAVSMMNDDKFNSAYHKWGHSYFSVCLDSSKPTDIESMIILIPRNESFELGSSAVQGSKYSYKEITYNHYGFQLAQNADLWYPCMIFGQNKENRTFDVVYFTTEKPNEYDGSILRRAYAIAANDIRFINKPYMSDMHWNRAFRNEMRIPDDIFPDQWKDLSMNY